jgi:hypothetical protein
MVIAIVLLLAAAGLLAYGVLTQYTSTDPTQSTAKRVWASVLLGAGALGAALVQWIHGMTGP